MSHKVSVLCEAVALGLSGIVPSYSPRHGSAGTSHLAVAAQTPLDFGLIAIPLCKAGREAGAHPHLAVGVPAWQEAECLGV